MSDNIARTSNQWGIPDETLSAMAERIYDGSPHHEDAETLLHEVFRLKDDERKAREWWKELGNVAAAIGTCEYMDPPDGGDVELSEQVRRMRADVLLLRERLNIAKALLRWSLSDRIDDSHKYGNEARCFLQGDTPSLCEFRPADVASTLLCKQCGYPLNGHDDRIDRICRDCLRGVPDETPAERKP